MTAYILVLIPIAFLIAWPATWLARRLAAPLGALDRPGGRKQHDRPIPVTGGVALFWAVVLPVAVGLLAAWSVSPDRWAEVAPALAVHIPGVRSQTPLALALLAGLALLHVVGVIDDRRHLGPFAKLAAQLAVALALTFAFPDMRLLTLLGAPASVAVTVLWLLVIVNAFNFLDNMDGLSGGVAVICAAMFLAAALIGGQWFVAALLALLIGALLGFLCFNFPPASIFMGDGGSLIVGLLLAFCSVRVTYYSSELATRIPLDQGWTIHDGSSLRNGWPESGSPAWWALFTPLVILAIPLYDLVSVTLIRLAQGRSPFVGDTQHFSHRLVARGLTRPAAVVVIYACTLATGLGGILLGSVAAWQACIIVAQTAAVLTVLALLERGRVVVEETERRRDGVKEAATKRRSDEGLRL